MRKKDFVFGRFCFFAKICINFEKFSIIIAREGEDMRKEYIYIAVLIACIIGVIWGIVGMLNTSYQVEEAKTKNNIEEIYEDSNTVMTVAKEEKVSPNTNFALKKYYDECSHFDYEEAELPSELINLTQQEVEDYYDDWEVEKFTENDLVLAKEINGYCNQHFLIRLDDEKVNVYRLGTLGELKEYQKTDIFKSYLPEEDVENLKEGIAVYGEGKLSSVLEDFE